MNPIDKILDDLFDLYDSQGNQDYIGESISQVPFLSPSLTIKKEHMVQAAMLAERVPKFHKRVI
jgi:predicted HD phosphohydrolase